MTLSVSVKRGLHVAVLLEKRRAQYHRQLGIKMYQCKVSFTERGVSSIYVRPNTSPSDLHLRGSWSVTRLCSLIVRILKNYLKIIDFVLTIMQKEEYKQMKNVTVSCIQRRKPLKWKKMQPKARVPPRGTLALGSTHRFTIASSTSTIWFPRSLPYMVNHMNLTL